MLKKTLLLFFLLLFVFFAGYKSEFFVQASIDESCSNVSGLSLDQAIFCQKQVEAELTNLKGAIKPNEDRLNQLKLDINNIIQRAAQIESDLKDKAELLEKGKEKIAAAKKIFDAKVRAFYIHQKDYSPVLVIFAQNKSISDLTKELTYQQKTTDLDKKNIIDIALYVKNVEDKKAELENENTRLSGLKTSLNSQIGELENLLSGANSYASKLSTAIAQLSARQQEFLNQRLAGLNIPRSAGSGGACSSDLTNGKNPGFSPAFGFFTYGVPNRVGLSQYGALGRSKNNETYDKILDAYYTNYHLECRSMPNNQINVDGYGQVNFNDYLKGLGEMPSSWGDQGGYEAFKAQIVAAASYAIAYTNNGSGSICSTDHCQVYTGGNKGGKWEQAVNDMGNICGGNGMQVMVENGSNQVARAWFSSSHGGYVHSSGDIGWEGTSFTKNAKDTASDSINNFTDLNNNAYDGPSHVDSSENSWFYCDWGSRANYDKTAWLKPEEVADIANVILLVRKNPSDACFVYQVDKSPPDPNEDCPQTGNWSADKVKQELGSGAFDNVSDISVSVDFNSGKTTNVNINGQSFPASEFKDWFNLRAPANIQIVGPLYNIEKK